MGALQVAQGVWPAAAMAYGRHCLMEWLGLDLLDCATYDHAAACVPLQKPEDAVWVMHALFRGKKNAAEMAQI
jgi:hypothetical protein